MTHMVVDASVVVKWLFPEREAEAEAEQALALLDRVKGARISMHQPPHWLAEVAAVLVRLSPATAVADVADLYAMNTPVENSPEVYLIACELARSLNHHVFHTLYHAVALALPDTVLVTADARYYRKARRRGAITLLRDVTLV